jgi:hypothetical protein
MNSRLLKNLGVYIALIIGGKEVGAQCLHTKIANTFNK